MVIFMLNDSRKKSINIIKNSYHNVANLDQDWAYGFCGCSRPDGYWTEDK